MHDTDERTKWLEDLHAPLSDSAGRFHMDPEDELAQLENL